MRALSAIRSADAAHRLRCPTRRGGPMRGDTRLHAPPRPPPAERDRDAPSHPAVLRRRATGLPTVGLASCEKIRAEGAPEAASGNSSLEPSECRICPSGRHEQTAARQARALAPAVTRPRPGYAASETRAAGAVRAAGTPGAEAKARPQGPGRVHAPVRGQQPVPGTARLPGPSRRPTWLILPVAYACLKD